MVTYFKIMYYHTLHQVLTLIQSRCLFIATHTFSHPPTLTPGNHGSVFHLYNFVILRMLYKWNNTVHGLLGLAFSISRVLWRFVQVVACSMYQNSSFLLLSSISSHGCSKVCLIIHILAITNKTVMNIYVQILCKFKFSLG